MNPFDWAGPPFLVFYIALIGLAVALLYLAIAAGEDGPAPRLPLADPYQIAWLRGGTQEAVRIAVLSLLDRKLIDLDITGISAKADRPPAHALPLERAVLDCSGGGGIGLRRLADDPRIAAAAEQCWRGVQRLGLVPSDDQISRRWLLLAIAAAMLVIVALIKLGLAAERGRGNVGFLIMLAVAAPFAAWLPVRRRRTRLGDRMLGDLRRLFGALRARAGTLRRGEMTSEAMLLAAVFGIGALPATGYVDLQQAYRQVDAARWSSDGGSSGSGCSSGGGSGCGGGGGCGGCGSS